MSPIQFFLCQAYPFGNFETGNYLNPYAEAMRGYRDYSRSNMLTTVEVKQNLDAIAKGLMARALVNFDRRSEYSISRAYVPFYYRISSFDLTNDSYRLVRLNPTTGRETLDYDANNTSRTVANSFYFEGATQYNNNFGKNSINGLLVFTARQFKQGAPSTIQLSLPTRNLSFPGDSHTILIPAIWQNLPTVITLPNGLHKITDGVSFLRSAPGGLFPMSLSLNRSATFSGC